jgi:D-amino peptidase
MRKIGQIPPYRMEGPVTLQIEYTTRNALPVDIRKGAEMVDARTIRYTGSNFLDMWKRYGER